MTDHAPAMPHGAIDEVFDDVFFVTGTMRAEFFGSAWQFSRNMTIVREDGRLSLINAVRLDEPGLAALEALGEVANVVRIGAMHGLDDAFYVERYGATLWAPRGMPGPAPDAELTEDGAAPIADARVFAFRTTKLPEAIVVLERAGGVAVACDALQNWVAPDAMFDDETVKKMTDMGFFTKANCGPAWMHGMQPKKDDFERLERHAFRHALCGHGVPLRDTAGEDFRATFARLFPG